MDRNFDLAEAQLKEMTIIDNVSISPGRLAFLVNKSPKTTLIVDCRGFTEYNKGHVKSSINAFFSSMIKRRLYENKIDNNCLLQHLNPRSNNMNQKLDVVLYAEEDKPARSGSTFGKKRSCAFAANESASKIVRTLRDRLEDTRQFRTVMYLEGGFKQFAAQYPQLCEPSEGMNRLTQSVSQPCLSNNPYATDITKILPNVYLGSQMDSLNAEKLKALDIVAVINLSVTCPKSVCIKEDKNFLRIPVNDSYQEKLSPFFDTAYEFLEDHRKRGNNVLIHCLAGISRSPTLCISYIMRSLKMGSDQAYKYVKEKRPSISPNLNFMGQLLEYEQRLVQEKILTPEQTARAHCSNENPMVGSELCPAKVPKSASSHCVYTPVESVEWSCEDAASSKINENGKRGFLEVLSRPRALGISNILPVQDVPSPSTELSRLSFDSEGSSTSSSGTSSTDEQAIAFMNPCFRVPVTPVRSVSSQSASNQIENPVFYDEKRIRLAGAVSPGSRLDSFEFRWKSRGTPRPECLKSAGVLISSNTLLSTTEEEETESPESGYSDDLKQCQDDDNQSRGSHEITCQ